MDYSPDDELGPPPASPAPSWPSSDSEGEAPAPPPGPPPADSSSDSDIGLPPPSSRPRPRPPAATPVAASSDEDEDDDDDDDGGFPPPPGPPPPTEAELPAYMRSTASSRRHLGLKPVRRRPRRPRQEVLEDLDRRPKLSPTRMARLVLWANELADAGLTEEDFADQLRTGLVLEALMRRLVPDKCEAMPSLARRALTQRVAEGNLEKVLSVVWRAGKVNSRRVPTAAQLYAADPDVSFALLDEVFRVYAVQRARARLPVTLAFFGEICANYGVEDVGDGGAGDCGDLCETFATAVPLFCVLHFFGAGAGPPPGVRLDFASVERRPEGAAACESNARQALEAARALGVPVFFESAAEFAAMPDEDVLVVQLDAVFERFRDADAGPVARRMLAAAMPPPVPEDPPPLPASPAPAAPPLGLNWPQPAGADDPAPPGPPPGAAPPSPWGAHALELLEGGGSDQAPPLMAVSFAAPLLSAPPPPMPPGPPLYGDDDDDDDGEGDQLASLLGDEPPPPPPPLAAIAAEEAEARRAREIGWNSSTSGGAERASDLQLRAKTRLSARPWRDPAPKLLRRAKARRAVRQTAMDRLEERLRVEEAAAAGAEALHATLDVRLPPSPPPPLGIRMGDGSVSPVAAGEVPQWAQAGPEPEEEPSVASDGEPEPEEEDDDPEGELVEERKALLVADFNIKVSRLRQAERELAKGFNQLESEAGELTQPEYKTVLDRLETKRRELEVYRTTLVTRHDEELRQLAASPTRALLAPAAPAPPLRKPVASKPKPQPQPQPVVSRLMAPTASSRARSELGGGPSSPPPPAEDRSAWLGVKPSTPRPWPKIKLRAREQREASPAQAEEGDDVDPALLARRMREQAFVALSQRAEAEAPYLDDEVASAADKARRRRVRDVLQRAGGGGGGGFSVEQLRSIRRRVVQEELRLMGLEEQRSLLVAKSRVSRVLGNAVKSVLVRSAAAAAAPPAPEPEPEKDEPAPIDLLAADLKEVEQWLAAPRLLQLLDRNSERPVRVALREGRRLEWGADGELVDLADVAGVDRARDVVVVELREHTPAAVAAAGGRTALRLRAKTVEKAEELAGALEEMWLSVSG